MQWPMAVAVLLMNMLLLIIIKKDLAWSCLWDNPMWSETII
ncbi:hypothetical protein Gotri_014114, partial [Gossypium trilobum]|nr:hypothetical protein [Gossypium trilobum]